MKWLQDLKQIDFLLFQLINGFAGTVDWLDAFGIFISEYLIILIGVGVICVVVYRAVPLEKGRVLPSSRSWFFPGGMQSSSSAPSIIKVASRNIDFITLWRALFAAGGGYVLRVILGYSIARVRPFLRAIDATHLSSNLTDASFPSGHATVAFALACSVAWKYPKVGSLMMVCAALVAVGRVFTGVHYPADVVGGAALGLISAYIARIIVNFFYKASRQKILF